MESVNCGGRRTASSSGEFDDRVKDFWNAERILKKRGFNTKARKGLLGGLVFDRYGNDVLESPKSNRWFKRSTKLVKEHRRKLGPGDGGVLVFTAYSPDNGRKIHRNTYSQMAKTVSKCFRRARPWTDCKLNYHPVDGCFLTKSQRVDCKRIGIQWQKYEASGDIGSHGRYFDGSTNDSAICWNYEKGPRIQLPYQASAKSQIKLAAAKVKKQTAAAKKKKKVVINPRGRPVCKSAFSNGPACLSSGEGC